MVMATHQATHKVTIRLAIEGGVLFQFDAITLASAVRDAAGQDASVETLFARPGKLPEGVRPMMGVEAVVASIALPSLAFVAKAVRDVILEHLRAKASATVEIETPDGRKVKLTGPEAKSDRVLEILNELAGK
jgi:hypothetical protein